MNTDLPSRIPTRAAGTSVASALATREHLEGYASAAETCARTLAAEIDGLKVELQHNRTVRALWRPGDTADLNYAAVLARVGYQIKSGDDFTRAQLDSAIRTRTRALEANETSLALFNAAAIAGRAALALFRPDDPPDLTYAQATARHTTAQPPAPTVHVATPFIDMRDRGPRTITMTKLPDGSMRAEVAGSP